MFCLGFDLLFVWFGVCLRCFVVVWVYVVCLGLACLLGVCGLTVIRYLWFLSDAAWLSVVYWLVVCWFGVVFGVGDVC